MNISVSTLMVQGEKAKTEGVLITIISGHLKTISEQRLNWRRDKVRKLSVKGYTPRRIDDTLKIPLAL